LVRHITIGATWVALLAVGTALGHSPSQATAAIAPTELVVTYAGVEQTPEVSAVIIKEKTTPSTIDPIESSGMPLGTSL
jgi:hypothetical protein